MADLIDITLDRMPSWLLGPWGRAWNVVQGAALEAFSQAAREATRARFASRAPSDALSLTGGNVGMARARNETEASFRARQLQAFATWERCGTPGGLRRAIDALFPEYPPSTVVQEYWDGGFSVDDARWARFRIETTIPHWSAAPKWNAFFWDDGSHWDVTAPEADLQALRATIRRWKPANTRCERLRVFVSGGTFVDIPNP